MDRFHKQTRPDDRLYVETPCSREVLAAAFSGLSSGAQQDNKIIDHLEQIR